MGGSEQRMANLIEGALVGFGLGVLVFMPVWIKYHKVRKAVEAQQVRDVGTRI